MEGLAFYLTFIITVLLSVISAFYIRGRFKKAIAVYVATIVLISGAMGFVAPMLLVNALDSVGIVQDFGHGGKAIASILNLCVGLIMVPIGIVVIKWVPQKC